MTAERFHISIPDAVLDDLRERLVRTRFTTASDASSWTAGVDPDYLRGLVAYWADGFDWRGAEAHLNTYPNFRAEVGGSQVHFVHMRGKGPAAGPAPLPLVLSHGWPSTFVEMLRITELLTDPAAHGGDPADAFDVVIPSLPGFAFSAPPPGRFTRRGVAEAWHELMTEVLGYPRYGAQGGDIGGGVTQWIGALFPDQVTGVLVTSAVIPADFAENPATPEEQKFLDAMDAYDREDGGYSEIMRTRPDTVAAALTDSPAGLLAWIVDKYRDWSDCGGDVATRWDRDTLLTVATLYWATESIGTSFRQYYDYPLNRPRPPVAVPGAVTLSNEPAYRGMPRSLAERVFPDLRQLRTPERGGHFMAHEEPEQLARDLRDFFRPLRG
ncbi:epoxide hydrolase family protein [Yinghuangia soli]|uniref:Epoxide hydrolase n=1 Tax=Yinghuangia soli TaxID=2908204 RepID=A0AA41PYT7_9ACTN|nr:epoxide hydrolase family protein [Yinghuangia soli]MCF2527855.1 epoxide hydrolase [Yinghuangia soli]